MVNGGLLPPGDGAASPLAAVAEGSRRYRKLLEKTGSREPGKRGTWTTGHRMMERSR